MNERERLNDLIFNCLEIIVQNEGGFVSGTDVGVAFNWNYADFKGFIENYLTNKK